MSGSGGGRGGQSMFYFLNDLCTVIIQSFMNDEYESPIPFPLPSPLIIIKCDMKVPCTKVKHANYQIPKVRLFKYRR